jgi:hypothetical protein
MVVKASPAVSVGRSFVDNLMRQITVVSNSTASPIDLLTAYNAKFGSIPNAGQRIFVQIYFINKTTGLASGIQQTSAVVAA